jgi:hypothetical protein
MPANTKSSKGRANFYRPGSNNVICDRTGFKMKVEDCSFEWNGLFVRKDSWEARQPQDLLRGLPDDQRSEVSRPGNVDVFLADNEVTPDDL